MCVVVAVELQRDDNRSANHGAPEAFLEGSPFVREALGIIGISLQSEPPEIVGINARTDEPAAWMKVAEERKLEHPSFSRDDLAAEIVKSGARKYEPPAESTAPPKVWGKCGECGHVGWMEKLPVGSGGQPVDVEEYKEE